MMKREITFLQYPRTSIHRVKAVAKTAPAQTKKGPP